MTDSSSPVLVFGPSPVDSVELPDPTANLFQRLIRNPRRSANRPPRERECAEMVAAVMLNAPILRDAILSWLMRLAGHELDLDPTLDWSIQTEGNVLSKRDDLRITLSQDDETVLLYTVEVKVGSGFHESTSVEKGNSDDDHQITNYDQWLRTQHARHKAGFVVALNDMSAKMPAQVDLHETWVCTTWATLGRELTHTLKGLPAHPSDDALLGQHMLGFIQQHLRGNAPMDTDSLNFDDIALLRAVGQLGTSLEEKVKAMVRALEPSVADYVQGPLTEQGQKGFLRETLRRHIWMGPVVAGQRFPLLMAGVVTRQKGVAVWLETSPKHPDKDKVTQAVAAHIHLLRERGNRPWEATNREGHWDVECRLPLHALLSGDDPVTVARSFVEAALSDLKEVGLLDALQRELGTAGD